LHRLLPNFEKGKSLSSDDLNSIFKTFANLRQPKTAALVKGARLQGEDRVVDGGREACEERDERLRQKWKDEVAVEEKYDSLLMEPF
jgi:salicylate hydroxylase